MSAKTTPQKPGRKKAKSDPAPAHTASTLAVAGQNLINMVVVSATSGTVLLALLAARHFEALYSRMRGYGILQRVQCSIDPRYPATHF